MKLNSYVTLSITLLLSSNIAFAADLTAEVPTFSYVVKKDESFSVIAAQYMARYSDIPKLAAFNHWTVQKKLQPNQVIRIPKQLLKIKPVVTELIALTGDLQVKSAKDNSVKPAKLNQLLSTGDALISSASGKATIRFADGTTTELQPNSQLKLIAIGQYAGLNTYVSDIQLDVGRVEVIANPQHQQGNAMRVITPSAVAAVRGTKFRVGAEGLVGFEETLDGSVGLSGKGEQVLVDRGFGSVVEKDQAPTAPVALLAAPDVSQLDKTIKTKPVVFTMPQQVNVAVWSAQITRADGTVAQQLLSKDSTSITLADTPDGVYAMRVRGQDKLGLQGYDSEHHFEVNARPFAPVLEPSSSPFRALPNFTWKTVDGAERYLVEVSQAESFSEKTVNTEVSTNAFSFNQLNAGKYYLRVATIEQAETSAYSQPQAFVYQPLGFVPDFNRREFDFVNVANVKLNLPPLPETFKYEVMLTRDAERQQIIWQKILNNSNGDFTKPVPGNYYYSVRYLDDAGIKGPTTTYPIQVR